MILFRELLNAVKNRFRYISLFNKLYHQRVIIYASPVNEDEAILKTRFYFDGDIQLELNKRKFDLLSADNQQQICTVHCKQIEEELNSIRYLGRHLNTLAFFGSTIIPILVDFENALYQYIAISISAIAGFLLRRFFARHLWQFIQWCIRGLQVIVEIYQRYIKHLPQ